MENRRNVHMLDINLPPIKILVVDDEHTLRALMVFYLQKLGQQVVEAENGAEAIRQFEAETPDLVIMDVMMPEMDGYEATRRIKEIAGGLWVPVIFTSALSTPEEQIKGLNCGGDDYLVKPVNYDILASKIQAMQRIAAMQQRLADSLQQLETYQKKTEEELDLARYMMRQLTHADALGAAGVEMFNHAAGAFSGDMVAAAASPDGVKYILLADVTGHGLSSALNSMPLVDVFYELTERGTPPEELCRQMNRKLKRVMPPGYFVAATLAIVDAHNKTIRVWNGGLPDALFVTAGGEVTQVWKSRHLAIGILSDNDFDDSMESMTWHEPGQLVMYTDGLTEATTASGEEFGMARLCQCLQQADEKQRVSRVQEQLAAFLNGAVAHDDVTLITVSCA